MRIKNWDRLIINNSTRSGVAGPGIISFPELRTGLLLLMSFGHFFILKGFYNNSHGCNPWKINEIRQEPRSGFNS